METERLNRQDDREKGREEEKAAKEGRGEGGRKEEEMREETKKKKLYDVERILFQSLKMPHQFDKVYCSSFETWIDCITL